MYYIDSICCFRDLISDGAAESSEVYSTYLDCILRMVQAGPLPVHVEFIEKLMTRDFDDYYQVNQTTNETRQMRNLSMSLTILFPI